MALTREQQNWQEPYDKDNENSRYGFIYENPQSNEYKEAMAYLKSHKYNSDQIRRVMTELRSGAYKFDVSAAIEGAGLEDIKDSNPHK